MNMFSYVMGVLLVITGGYWFVTQEIQVSIEGKSPFFCIRGMCAAVLGVIVAIIGIFILLYPQILSYFSFYRG